MREESNQRRLGFGGWSIVALGERKENKKHQGGKQAGRRRFGRRKMKQSYGLFVEENEVVGCLPEKKGMRGGMGKIYVALERAGVRTFRDNDNIDRGQELKPEIDKVIKESRASIVVLSQKYANSRWCLDKLLLILEQRLSINQMLGNLDGLSCSWVRIRIGRSSFLIHKLNNQDNWSNERPGLVELQ
ncbi:unnamed protein product [Lactuca saligna]|uniref:TIR domain-containing protein n=1 Tax=Lactuca saligna TaxID=75948 RepID=A0AA35ZIU0_LACSI|nr:unnamed protein product [Lactuca saligna]